MESEELDNEELALFNENSSVSSTKMCMLEKEK